MNEIQVVQAVGALVFVFLGLTLFAVSPLKLTPIWRRLQDVLAGIMLGTAMIAIMQLFG